MATKQVNCSKDATVMSDGAASGYDDHHPIGKWPTGFVTRALLYFPISFSGMTGITSATLHLRYFDTAGVRHAGQGSSSASLEIRRKTSSWPETSNHGENSWGTGRGLDWDDVLGGTDTESGKAVHTYSVGSHGDWTGKDITDIVTAWFNGSANHGIMVKNLNESSSSESKEFGSRHLSGYVPYIEIVYTTNTAPNAPDLLEPNADEVRHTGSSVVLSGRRDDPDSGDWISQYRIQVWNNGLSHKYADVQVNPGGQPTTFSRTVSGLPTNVTLRWRAMTADKEGAWGPWSDYKEFSLNTVPNVPTLALLESPTTDVKTLTPTFKVTHNDEDPGDAEAFKYQIQLELADGTAVWDSGEVTLGTPVTTVSKLYNATALQWATAYRWRARTQDEDGQWSPWSSYATFTTHEAGVPINLSPSGVTVGGIEPQLQGSRATTADLLTSAQVQVYDSTGVTLIWDSGDITSGVSSTGFLIPYGGTALAFDTVYQWRGRVTSSVGGTSEWSSLQSFTTTSADDIQIVSPVGSGIADLTPDFEFNRTDAFDAYQIVLYEADGTTVVWDSGVVAHVSATSKVVTYPGTPALEWATTYQWKVQVSSDAGSTWGNGYTDLSQFTTEEAGVPTLSTPTEEAWLGAPLVLEQAESLTGVTGSAESTVTLDAVTFDEGAAAFKAAITALNGSTDAISVAKVIDLSAYGDQTVVKAAVRASSLTNVSSIRLRLLDSLGAYVEYDIAPAGTGAFETVTAVKGSPDGSSGTIDWADIAELVIRVTTSASATFDLHVDDIQFDATNPSFDGDATGGETIDTVRIIVYASDQTTEVWDSGDVAVSATSFSVAYAGPALTPGSTYYWTAQYTENTGPTGGFAALRAFSINAAPSAPTGMEPNTGDVVDDTPEFISVFEDADLTARGDTPSVYEVEVRRNSDAVLMHTLRAITGLAAGSNTLQRTSEGTGLSFEVEYKWRARYADSFGAYGAWSSFNVFKPSEPPTVTITAPGATITSPSFDVEWTFSSPGGKAQNRFRVVITRDSDEAVVYDSGIVFSSVASHTVPGGFLTNSINYTIAVTATDTDGLESAEDTTAILSAWAAPDAVTGFSITANEATSEMALAWDESTLSESDFSYYLIYRRLVGGEWERYATVTDKAVTTYSDFFAGHGESYEYKVTVWKVVVGDVDVESGDSEIPVAILDPDAWFVIGADRDESHIFELPVYDESHTEPIQQEVFEPLGSRRKTIVRGKVLGAEGTVQVQWTDSERAVAKTQLRYLTDTAGPHILKSPFGDVWQVEFSGPGKKYTGGGHLGVTLTWIEVA